MKILLATRSVFPIARRRSESADVATELNRCELTVSAPIRTIRVPSRLVDLPDRDPSFLALLRGVIGDLASDVGPVEIAGQVVALELFEQGEVFGGPVCDAEGGGERSGMSGSD